MKYSSFYVAHFNGKSNCVIRSLCKLLNEDYDKIYNDLCDLQRKLDASSYNDIIVFETFMNNNNISEVSYGKDIMIKDWELDNGSYIVFCYDKKDFYHMVTIIDNVLYDKDDSSLDLYVIKLYKKN